MSISLEIARGCAELVAQVVVVAVRDARNLQAPAEVRQEARGWIQNGGLRWACGWLDLDHDWLLNRLRQVGVFDDTVAPAPSVRERQQAALTLKQQGKSYRAIGDLLGVSYQTVFRDVKAAMVEQETP